MTTPDIPFNRNAVEPIACLKAGWELVKPQYWLIVGMCFIGFFIGSAVPLGILMGPMMCGIYLTYFALRRGEPVEFGLLFKGFEFFGPSVVATLIHAVPIVVVVVPMYLLFYVSMVVSIAAQGNEPNPVAFLGVMATFSLVLLVVFIAIIIISIGFTFVYPLIVDRRLQGLDAVKLSFRAAMGNFWRLLGMMLLGGLLGICGMLICYVGIFLVFPITYGAVATAYEQVFGLSNTPAPAPDVPPPPPSFT